jgi:DNA-binding NarL/FixJ family response regulator
MWKEGLQMTKTEPAERLPGGRSVKLETGTARLSTVIASAPGIAEQSLRATLESLPAVRIIGTAAGCLSALQMVHLWQVDLLVIDSNLPFADVQVLLQQLKDEGLATQSLVLTASSAQVRRALAAGADAALRRDTSIQQLGAAVAGLRRANTEAGSDGGNRSG